MSSHVCRRCGKYNSTTVTPNSKEGFFISAEDADLLGGYAGLSGSADTLYDFILGDRLPRAVRCERCLHIAALDERLEPPGGWVEEEET